MEEVTNLTQINLLSVLLGLFIILLALKEIIETVLYFKKKFRIKTGADSDKEKEEKRIAKLEEHDAWQYTEITKISKGIEDIQRVLSQDESRDNERIIATSRNQLYDLHDKFMSRGSIDRSGLKTFLELGRIYEQAGGNDIYHDKLKPDVINLPIKEQ